MSGFNDFVSAELPKRPFSDGDGLPGQMLVRSANPLAVRQMVWVDAPSGVGAGGITAAVAIGGHSVVTLDENGLAVVADASNPLHQFIAGISVNAAGAGDTVSVATTGVLEHLGWSFVTGLPVFLGLGGVVVQILPPTAVFSKVLGIAVGACRISVSFQTAIFLGA